MTGERATERESTMAGERIRATPFHADRPVKTLRRGSDGKYEVHHHDGRYRYIYHAIGKAPKANRWTDAKE